MTIPPFYSIEVITPSGETVETIDNPISLVAARSYSAVGSAVLTILPDYDEEFFRYNMRFKLWRTDSVYGKALFGDTIWFLRKFTHNVSQRNYAIEVADSLTLLSNPLVAYTSQTTYADKTLEEFNLVPYTDYFRIDNLMKQYVRENFSSGALDVARRNPLIVVEENLNLAPHGEKTASWAKLSSVLSDLARMSAEKGMELFYDLIPQSNNTFMFKVWRDIRGVDHGFSSSGSLIFSDENGDLDDVTVVYDYSQMATYCYILGLDAGPSQVIVEVGNPAIIESDPFGRIEFTTNSTDNDELSVLLDDGRSALFALRPRRVLSARLAAASSLRYGTDFAYGDRVGVQVGGRRYDCQVSAVRAEWRDGRELLDVRLDGSEALWNPTYWEGADRTPAPIVVPPAHYEVPADVEEPPPDPVEAPFNSGLVAGVQNVAVFGGRVDPSAGSISIWRTSNFQDAVPSWDHFIISGGGFPYSFVVNPFSPGYIEGSGAVNAWVATGEKLYYIEDVFADIPTVTVQIDFAVDYHLISYAGGLYGQFRTIGASFGRYFENDAENPWLICAWIDRGASSAPYYGLWTMYSVDAGVTWSAPSRINANYEAWADKQLTEPLALYMSPRTPGLAFLGGYSDIGLSAVPSTGAAYVTTDWGATWSALSDPPLEPENSTMGDIHVPWQGNEDESLVYHGALEKIELGTDRIIFKLKRVSGGTVANISPIDSTVSYGPARYSFSIRAYDSDKNYMVLAGKGNGVDDQASNKYAVFVSADGGDTWELVLGPIADADGTDTSNAHPHQAAFAGDSQNIIFAWGPRGYFQYSEDFGQTWADKAYGTAASLGWRNAFGIAGGPAVGTPEAWDVEGLVAAYEPINAGTLAESYVNIANPGVYDAVPSATPPALNFGWEFPNNLACYLDTGIAANAGWSMVVQFELYPTSTFGSSLAGAVATDGSSGVFSIYQVYVNEGFNNRNYSAGGAVSMAPSYFAAVMAIAGQQGYLDGVADGAAIPTPLPMATRSLYIGCTNGASGPMNAFHGRISHLYIYNRTLTAEEITAIYNAIL